MTRTLVISDLHLGSRQGRDVLRHPDVLDILLDSLADVDRLVLLGDVVELLEARARRAMETARPVLRAIGAALGPRREVAIVPGNHDHALIRTWVYRRMRDNRPLDLATPVPMGASRRLAAIVGWLAPAQVTVSYPGVWITPRVWATHGHYLDRHLLPDLGWPTQQLFGRVPRAGAVPEDYEHATGATTAALAGLSSSSLPWPVEAPLDLAVQVGHRVAAAGAPVAGVVTRGALAPLSAGVLGYQFRRSGLPAFGQVVRRLAVDADHVLFGHVHRMGPLPTDDGAEWTAGPALHNTGSWVYEPLILAGAEPSHPYWPGGAIVVDGDEAPRLEALLGHVEPSGLR